MPEGGELISPADLDRWLTPTQAVERLSFPLNDRLPWILRRLAIGEIKAWARKPTFGSIPRELWNEPWQLSDRPFWLTGDAEFSQLDPYEISHQVVHYLDVRFDPADFPARPVPPPSVPTPVKGGRPTAAWWDDLWIEICRQIYGGELVPNRQSDIEKAMHEWLAARGHSASEATIRGRARRLHQALHDEGKN